MKKFLLIFSSLCVLSAHATTSNIFNDLNSFEQKNIVSSVMNELKDEGQFENADENTIKAAQYLVQDIISNPQLLLNFQNGDLILDDQFVANYFLKNTLDSIGNFLSGSIRDIAGAIASVANKTLTALTSSKVIMESIKAGIKVINILLPIGATMIAGASFLGLTPVGGALLTVALGTAAKIFNEIVNPTNVETALKLAVVGTNLADTLLNPPKEADEAPSMPSLEKKSQKASQKQIGESMLMVLKIGKSVEQYIDKIGESGWKKIDKKSQQKLLNLVNKAHKIAASIDPKKLKN